MATFPKNEIISLTSETPRYDLAESVGPDLRLGALLDPAAEQELRDLVLGYGTAAGDVRLREILAELHGVQPEDVVITVGGMQALFLLAFILCDRGDEVVTTSPLFPLARNAVEAVGATVRVLELSFDQGYRIDLDALRARLSERTKLVSLASPQNPSGVAIPKETVRVILEVMAEVSPEAFLLLDATYRDAAYGDEPVASACLELSRKVISCASLSKCHGAPGLRLGWAITKDAALREQLVLGKFNTAIACATVDEFLALKVLEQRDRLIGDRRQLLAEGLAKTERWVRENSELVDWVKPDAGALCCVRLKSAVFDEAAVQRFYEATAREGVRVANGTWFGEQARVFRLGFGFLPMPELDAALERLTAAVRQAVRAAA